MLFKILKRILSVLLFTLLLGSILMIIPRVWSALNPEKPPVGYHFVIPGYIAVATGLEN